MKLASLFSGGKDSTYATYKAMKDHDVVCLITIKSNNPDSYMFHTPNIDITQMQAESMQLPLLTVETKGEKELELKDLKNAIIKAMELFQIEGVITGAIESVYQASRVQKICDELNLWCFNPLWQINQIDLLKELLENKFEIIISAVAAFPFDESWLGKKIDKETIIELIDLQKKFKISPSGEGGEFESLVLNCPLFKKKIKVISANKTFKNYAGMYQIQEANLE